MKKTIFLFLILILSITLRLFMIDKVPATLYGDEQAFAWNAYSVMLTGKDEHGVSYPLEFRSFDDYKAPLPVYLLIPFIKVLGLNSFAIRLPIVLASTLTVLVTYYLINSFLSTKPSLLAAFLMSISPWHIHLSRGYFESTLSLLFFLLGVLFIVGSKWRFGRIFLGMLFFSLSMYSYFTPRILVPLFIIFLFWYGKQYYFNKLSNYKTYLLNVFILLVLMLPLLNSMMFGKGFSRFDKLSENTNLLVTQAVNRERNATNLPLSWRPIFHNKYLVRLRLIKNDYLEHLSINFWYLFGDNSLRYFTGNMGMFYLFEMPFFAIGLYMLFKKNHISAIFFLIWLLLAPIPASLVGRSFAVRSLAMLPAPFVFVSWGIYQTLLYLRNRQVKIIFIGTFSLIVVFFMSFLLIRYYLEYPVYAATWWGWENKAAIDYAKEREEQYDQIFISDFYTGAPLAFAVYTKYDPDAYRDAINNRVTLADDRHLIKMGKYYFGSLDLDERRLNENIIPPKSLYIARPEEADSPETIRAPDDDRVIFNIYTTK